MKTGKLILTKVLMGAALFVVADRSNAACVEPGGDLITALSNGSSVLQAELAERTNNPAATPQEKREAKSIGRALTTLGKTATNNLQLYSLFLKAAQQLGALAFQDPEIAGVGTNVFNALIAQAQSDIGCTDARISALGQFVRTKKSASNQLAQAVRTLNLIPQQSNPQIGLLLGRQVFQKLSTANKLAAIGERKPGFALDSVAGRTLRPTVGGESIVVQFINDTDAIESDSTSTNSATYTYNRTALNNATLVLTSDAGPTTTTVKMRYQSSTNGTFTFKQVESDGSRDSGAGRFTID